MNRHRFLRSRLAVWGALMAGTVTIVSLLAPFIAPHDVSQYSPNLLSPPSGEHLLGTDSHGRDLCSRILRGGWVTLSLALTTVLAAGLIGIAWGMTAAYTGGVAGTLLNRGMDVVMSFPSIMLALLVLAIAGTGGKLPLIVAIAITLTPRFARVIHGATLPVLKEDFIMAEKALGAGHARILGAHVLPNLVAPITVLTSIYLPFVIILESSLSFLGLGAPPDVPTWGRIIAEGKAHMQVAPWLTLFPGVAIVFTSLAFNLLGDGLRDLLDPKSSTRLYTR